MKYIANESFISGTWITKGNIYDEFDGYILFDDGYKRRFDLKLGNGRIVSSYFKPYEEELPQPHKSLLKDGDYVIDREGTEYIVSVKFGKFIDKETDFMEFDDIDDELTDEEYTGYDIMEIYRDGELIAKRTDSDSTEDDEKYELKNALKSLKEMVVRIEELIK